MINSFERGDCPGEMSFHDVVVTATVDELRSIFGEEDYVDNDIDEKVQHEWDFAVEFEDEGLCPISLYDWKEYREYSDYEDIEWHIGGESWSVTYEAKEKIEELLAELRR